MIPHIEVAAGTRQWFVKGVITTCPRCGLEVEIGADELVDEQLWYGEVFEHECPWCHEYFDVEVVDA